MVVPPVPHRPMPPPPPPMPTPVPVPPEITAQGKLLAGTYACKGNRQLGNGASTPLQSSLVVKLDLDNAWIVGSWTEKSGKFLDYRTFDDVAKQWTRMQLVSDGSHSVLTSTGDKAGEWVWEGVASSSHGNVTVRHHETLKGKELKIWGEAMLGGTWQKSYEATCKR